MNKIYIISVLAVLLVFLGCTKDWDNHYEVYPETVEQNFWDAMQNNPEISGFVQLLIQFELDTLFRSDVTYTVFSPDNNALQQYLVENPADTTFIKYHISAHCIQSGAVTGTQKIQTLSNKFALFWKSGSSSYRDGIEIKSESPLYLNGKYYIM